ncbi:MAG: Holliday junction resolvase RuvX [Acutalibacteraceae bacterium]
MIILSVDLGKARTGLAICDKTELLASPLKTVEERDFEKLSEKIADICKENKVEKIVMGLPKNMDGSEGESAQNARNFGKTLSEKTDLDVVFQDERCTTISAHNFLSNNNVRGKKRKAVVDTVSAVIILEDYIRYLHNS